MDSLINIFNEFHFIRPGWLLGLLVLFGIWLVLRKRPAHSHIDDLVDAHLQSVVVDDPVSQQKPKNRYLPALLSSLLVVALAGPTWERLPQPLYQLQQGRVIVLSLAKSMDRADMQPSRLQRARFKIEDLLTSMPGILTGLVGFAGEAFVVTPLSDDQDTISNLLQSLDSDTLPVQGFRADRGLDKARELLTQVKIDAGEIILVTDRASPLAVSTARKLSNDALHVSVLEVAPESDLSQSALLESIALSGRGGYIRMTPDDEDINLLNQSLKAWLSQSQSESSKTQRKTDQWRDFGPWLLIPVLILSTLVFRRGLLGLLPISLLAGLLSTPQPAQAFDWLSLWERDDQRQAKAVQAYRDKDMQTALQGFSLDNTATGAYNRGNALANSEQLEAALEAYDEAIRLRPDFEDARYNRQIVEAALAQKQQQEQEQKKQQQKDDSPSRPEEDPENPEPGENKQQGQEPEPDDTQNKSQTDSEDENQPSEQNAEADEKAPDQDKAGEEQQPGEISESDQPPPEETPTGVKETSGPMDEDAQALELMLRQVPDDPGALLRRKFKYQYQNQQP
ncbi:MAG: VWA domain-containing protein [Proteobacteria bacterium]|nr:VWA domain-containing protein [Pseudomonadota bacterium]